MSNQSQKDQMKNTLSAVRGLVSVIKPCEGNNLRGLSAACPDGDQGKQDRMGRSNRPLALKTLAHANLPVDYRTLGGLRQPLINPREEVAGKVDGSGAARGAWSESVSSMGKTPCRVKP